MLTQNQKINGRNDEKMVSNALNHASIVAIEGLASFGVGGMIGSFETVGSKGAFLGKEWCVKFSIGQEFSFPLRYSLDKLRKGLWG